LISVKIEIILLLILGEQKMETAETDPPRHRTVSPAKKAERPKSLPYHSLTVEPQAIRESPEFALDRVFPGQDKSAFTTSLDSGANRGHQIPSRSPKLRGRSQDPDTSVQTPKKVKLKKASSISSPIRNRRDLDHSEHSPFSSPRQRRSVKSKEAEDRLGYTSSVHEPMKSTSSPELSSPPAFPKGSCSNRNVFLETHACRNQGRIKYGSLALIISFR